MTLKNEEMLSKYFERKMTSSEEQNFLISVAANDELRLAFRSQLELMRAVSNDKDGIRSAVEVRSRTLAAIGLSTLAADSFLEHDLLSRKETATHVAQSAPVVHQAGTSASSNAPHGIANFFKRPLMTVVAGLTAGFIGAMAIFSGSPEEQIQPGAADPGAIVAPQSVGNGNTPQTLKTEQIREQSSPSAPILQVPATQSVERSAARAERKPVVETNTSKTDLQSKANVSQERITVDRQNPAPVYINSKITKPDDSAKKE